LRNNVLKPSRPSGRSGGSNGTKSGSVNTHTTKGVIDHFNYYQSIVRVIYVRRWHKADIPAPPNNVRYRGKADI
jgi:hypothetical protein